MRKNPPCPSNSPFTGRRCNRTHGHNPPHTSSGPGFSEQWTDEDIEREKTNPSIRNISQLAQRIFDLLKDADHIQMNVASLCALHRLATGSTEDAVFFHSGHGQPFNCWTGTDTVESIVRIEQRVYAYRLNGRERIDFHPFYREPQGYLYWNHPPKP